MSGVNMIALDGISKRFHRRITMRAVLTEILGFAEGRDAFWALKDVSFGVARGECVGIIGSNGAGKTTILKILAGVTRPTNGEHRLGGRVGSLIDVRAGFHPELTGAENVYLSGAIYGMSRKEIESKFDRIVNFAELGDAMDMPVKRYSSGMLVRLGFSVAAHIEPEVLLIDEVLSVGDAAFRAKCASRVRELRAAAGAVLLVSHDMLAVQEMCDRVIWLDGGRVKQAGGAAEVVRAYLHGKDAECGRREIRGGPLSITAVRLLDGEQKETDSFRSDSSLQVELDYRVERPIVGPRLELLIQPVGGEAVIGANQIESGGFDRLEGAGTVTCSFERLPLRAGRYQLIGCAYAEKGLAWLVHRQTFAVFSVVREGEELAALHATRKPAPVVVGCEWGLRREAASE
jgi:lipopolysaccharide transport system ATP-binding protein